MRLADGCGPERAEEIVSQALVGFAYAPGLVGSCHRGVAPIRRQPAPNENVRAEIGSVWPRDRSRLDPDLAELLGLVADLVEDRTFEQARDLTFDDGTIGQGQS
jgi:hypothetical protein